MYLSLSSFFFCLSACHNISFVCNFSPAHLFFFFFFLFGRACSDPIYQSLRGTSKVEAVHSVLDRVFYSQRGVGAEVFDARLAWWLSGYNRRRLHGLGKKVPPDSMPPKVCEHHIAHGLCTDYPDWSIAAPGTESHLKIGYEYARSVTTSYDAITEEDLTDIKEGRLPATDDLDGILMPQDEVWANAVILKNSWTVFFF